VQFSADFGDDRTLDAIAAGLERIAASTGCGVALFRAGAAPWHDDIECLHRVASRMPAASVKVFESLDVWDICALVASARAYCGSSLHGRIVAVAFARPRVNLRHPGSGDRCTRQSAFAQTWEPAGVPATVGVEAIAEGIDRALAANQASLEHTARRLASHCRHGFEAIGARLT
ncbi:MAG: polysaccharide pyruvyl transferase family protein, partial [Burkholderiales bacterium]